MCENVLLLIALEHCEVYFMPLIFVICCSLKNSRKLLVSWFSVFDSFYGNTYYEGGILLTWDNLCWCRCQLAFAWLFCYLTYVGFVTSHPRGICQVPGSAIGSWEGSGFLSKGGFSWRATGMQSSSGLSRTYPSVLINLNKVSLLVEC